MVGDLTDGLLCVNRSNLNVILSFSFVMQSISSLCKDRTLCADTKATKVVVFEDSSLRTFAPKFSYGEIFFISRLELGHKVLTPKMKKKWGSPTLFGRKWQWKTALISRNLS